MSMKIFRLSSFLFAIALVATAFCFESSGVAGSAISQNANSSTTVPTENSNPGTTRRTQGRRRKPAAPPAADTTAVPATEPSAAVDTAAAPVDTTEHPDLSGTYAGTFDCSDAGLTGETTLTITGNQFTTSDGKSGRITAATTRGYTGVAMQFGEFVPATNGQPGVPPTIVSMRAKKSRDRLTLTSVPGATRVCSFTPAGARTARARRATRPAATPKEAAQPTPVAEPVGAPVTPPATEPAKPPTTEPVTPPTTEPVTPPTTEPVTPPTTEPVTPPTTEPVTPPTTEPAKPPVAPVEPTPGDEAGPAPPAAPSSGRKSRKAAAKPKPAPTTPPN